jgi:hypothetical protein
MKTIALTLFAAALGLAQSSPSTTATPAKDSTPAAPAAQNKNAAPAAQNKKAAQSTKASTDPKAPAQKAKAQESVQTIPAGAKQVEPNLYQFTDSSGKTWNYRQTPFGISKWEETAASAQPVAPPAPAQSTQKKADPVVVTDLGDSYRFERKTPFGASTWVRKKSELNDEEKALTQSGDNSKAAGN